MRFEQRPTGDAEVSAGADDRSRRKARPGQRRQVLMPSNESSHPIAEAKVAHFARRSKTPSNAASETST